MKNGFINITICISIITVLNVSFCFAQEETNSVSLSISVTNPSVDEAGEIDVELDLPSELTMSDVLSTDGLNIQIDKEKGVLHVQDKVTLQAGETTFFTIEVKDLWQIPEDELNELIADMENFQDITDEYYILQQLDNFIVRLKEVLELQKGSNEDTVDHIVTYRAIKPEYDEVKKKFSRIKKAKQKQTAKAEEENKKFKVQGNLILNVPLLGIFAVVLLLGFKNREQVVRALQYFGKTKHLEMAGLFTNSDVTFKLLINQEEGENACHVRPFAFAGDLSDGKICLLLEENYITQTVLEIKIKLNDNTTIFRGSVIWQSKIKDKQNNSFYLSGIAINEISNEDLQLLKQHVAQVTVTE